jgi:hypothetical protein
MCDEINLTENLVALFWALVHSNLEFVSYFELRISSLLAYPVVAPGELCA